MPGHGAVELLVEHRVEVVVDVFGLQQPVVAEKGRDVRVAQVLLPLDWTGGTGRSSRRGCGASCSQ